MYVEEYPLDVDDFRILKPRGRSTRAAFFE